MCMTDYMQSSGRVGRDGLPSMCLTLLPHDASKPNPKDPETFSGRKAIKEMVSRKGECLRLIPSQHMDGRDTTCRGLYERDRNTIICAECFNKVDADERLDSQWTEPWGKD